MKTITLTLTKDELDVIAMGLGEVALKLSLPVAQSIEKQVQAALAAAEAGPDLKEAA